MPRPQKCRKVCQLPQVTGFMPLNGQDSDSPIVLTVDEYEAIRLIDKQGFSQEECGSYMKVARATVQQIYTSARRKMAEALVDGLPLRIEGGSYQLCDGEEAYCGCGGCQKHRTAKRELDLLSGGKHMKIAVTYENGTIFQHFGHTAQFKIYQIEQDKVVSSVIVDTNGSGHGALAGFLAENQVTALICGGIGGGARMALSDAGIQVFGGVQGDADEAVEALLQGTLAFNPNAACSHHGEGHNHVCGNHGCGEHHCG